MDGFIFTAVAGSGSTSWPFLSPMNAMKSPIPTANACFIPGLTASITRCRSPMSERARKSTPATNTVPSAARHGASAPAAAAIGTAVKTKKKFCPMPGARAMGYRA